MRDRNTEPASEIAEGLPPTLPVHDDRAELAEHDLRVNEPTAMQVFFAWEKLRIVYNLLLALLVLSIRGSDVFDLLPNFIEAAILANVCYCVGPVAEGYLCLLGLKRIPARLISCFLGLLLATYYTVQVVDRLSRQLPMLPQFPNGFN
jgi:hypothetical protein